MFSTVRIVASATVLALCSASLAACDPPTTPTPGGSVKHFSRSVVVTGTVTDTAGVSLNAVVIAITTGTGTSRTEVTNALGAFGVPLWVSTVVPTSASVTASRTGYSTITQSFIVPGEGPDTVTVPFSLLALGGPLAVGATISGSVSTANGPCYVGEPYESDYSRNCAFSSVQAPADSDVRVELRWSGPADLQLWAVEDWVVTAGSPGVEPGTVSLVVPRGRRVHLIVGPRSPNSAPTTPLAFTLSATQTSTSTSADR